MSYYNRYNEFIVNGDYIMVPGIKLAPKSSDRQVVYKTGKSRLLSNAQLDGNTKVQGLFSRNPKQTK